MARSQIYETPAVDGVLPDFLRDFTGTHLLFASIRPESEECQGGHFARRQREAVSLGRWHVRSNCSLHVLEGHSMVGQGGHFLDQIAQISNITLLHTPLSAQLQLAPLLSFEIASPLAHNPSPHDAAPKAKIRTFTTVNVIFFQFLLKPPQLRKTHMNPARP